MNFKQLFSIPLYTEENFLSIQECDELLSKILNSWYNIQELNSELLDHTHPLSTLSCALYINVDENNSALKFTNPNPFIGNQANTHPSPYNFDWWKENVAKGKLIIFPSWLKHGATKSNQETTKRVVISVNAV